MRSHREHREADAIINLPKLKTHGMTVLTGADKNLFGCVPGKRKVQWDFNTGVDHDSFTLMLVELSSLLKPRLTVMDAVVGMEGNGPGSGDPSRIGVVLAGQDPVALDVISGLVVGLSPEDLPVIRAASKAGTGTSRARKISRSWGMNCQALWSRTSRFLRGSTPSGGSRSGRAGASRTR